MCTLTELKGGGVEENMATLQALMSGQKNGVSEGLRNSVLFNAGMALWIANASDSLETGIALARETLDDGQVAAWLKQAKEFYQTL